MAMKAMLFMLACLLLVTVRVSSEEEIGGEAHAPVPRKPNHRRGHHPLGHAPGPYHHHFHFHHHAEIPEHHGCITKCTKYCEEKPEKRWCVRVCKECCRKFKCVPLKENICKAPSWDNVVMYRGELVRCP